jgi:hypothetical protein
MDFFELKQIVEDFLLGFEGLIFEGDDLAGVVDAVDFFEDPDDGEVVVTADVHAKVERTLAIESALGELEIWGLGYGSFPLPPALSLGESSLHEIFFMAKTPFSIVAP